MCVSVCIKSHSMTHEKFDSASEGATTEHASSMSEISPTAEPRSATGRCVTVSYSSLFLSLSHTLFSSLSLCLCLLLFHFLYLLSVSISIFSSLSFISLSSVSLSSVALSGLLTALVSPRSPSFRQKQACAIFVNRVCCEVDLDPN